MHELMYFISLFVAKLTTTVEPAAGPVGTRFVQQVRGVYKSWGLQRRIQMIKGSVQFTFIMQ